MTDMPAPTGEMPKPANGELPAATKTEIDPAAVDLVAENARLQAALKERNKEEAGRRKKLEALEAAEVERAQAALSETDKLKKQLADSKSAAEQAVANANERVIMSELRAQAASMGFTDLEYAVFKVRPKVTLAEDGTVEGAEAALKELATKSPVLIKKAAALNPGNPGGAQTGETLAQQRARIYDEGGSMFDRATSDATGGGVFFIDTQGTEHEGRQKKQ